MSHPSLLSILLVILMPHDGSWLSNIISEIQKFLLSNEDIISKTASIVTIFGVSLPLLKTLFERRRNIEKEPVKITVEINGNQITVEAGDEREVEELLRRFARLHPIVDKQGVSDDKVKIRARIPKRHKTKRKRR